MPSRRAFTASVAATVAVTCVLCLLYLLAFGFRVGAQTERIEIVECVLSGDGLLTVRLRNTGSTDVRVTKIALFGLEVVPVDAVVRRGSEEVLTVKLSARPDAGEHLVLLYTESGRTFATKVVSPP